MVDAALVGVGALVVLCVFADALMTTLTVAAGAGPFTARLLRRCWRVLLAFHKTGAESSFLTAGGSLLLVLTVLTWVTGLWAGWTAVFVGSDTVVESTSRQPAGVGDIVYFTGLTVFTLGTGDFVADAPLWRIVMAAASFSGLFLITLAITYLISVVAAVVERRALALQINGLGRTSQELVVRGWQGEGFSDMFEQQLISLAPQVMTSAEQQLAYPVLHYFRASHKELSATLAMAKLEDSLWLLEVAVAPGSRPDASAVAPLLFGVDRYIVTATRTAAPRRRDVPEAPSRALLEQLGVPLTTAEDDRVREEWENRRRQLHQLVANDGWHWPGRLG